MRRRRQRASKGGKAIDSTVKYDPQTMREKSTRKMRNWRAFFRAYQIDVSFFLRKHWTFNIDVTQHKIVEAWFFHIYLKLGAFIEMLCLVIIMIEYNNMSLRKMKEKISIRNDCRRWPNNIVSRNLLRFFHVSKFSRLDASELW